jgi:hypothetical protein
MNSNMSTPFSSALVSDKSGDLLFYTTDTFVYNKNYVKMENGAFLARYYKVLQAAIIVLKPNGPHLYYLITLKNSNCLPRFGPLTPAGLYDSVVTTNAEIGLGKVITKTILLTSLVSEKLTTTKIAIGLCNNDKIRFYPDALRAQLTTDELNGNFTSKSTLIWVRVDTPLGCGGIVSFNLILNQPSKTANINTMYTICFYPDLKSPVIVSTEKSNTHFEWQDSTENSISNAKNFTLNKIGDFSLTFFSTENGIECALTPKNLLLKMRNFPYFLTFQ